MHMQGDVVNEAPLPTSERGQDVLKNGFIPLFPNVPASQDHHFCEKGFMKLLSCLLENILKRYSIFPIDLKVIPDSDAEVAVEKQVLPIFSCVSRTKNAV